MYQFFQYTSHWVREKKFPWKKSFRTGGGGGGKDGGRGGEEGGWGGMRYYVFENNKTSLNFKHVRNNV